MTSTPIPGSHTDDRKHKRRKRPPSGLPGWAGAWNVLERIDRDTDRELLTRLTRESGFQGSALKHYAQCAKWEAGLGDYHPAPEGLGASDAALVRSRAASEVAAAVSEDSDRLPRARAQRSA